MPRPKRTTRTASFEIPIKQIDYRVTLSPKNVRSSDDIKPCHEILGQDRAIEAIKMGLAMRSKGYNIFVTGQSGTGRTSTIRHLLQQLDHEKPDLRDICYVNNFKNEDNPRVLVFKAGDGKRFRKDMAYLIDSIRKVVPKIFLSEDYKDRFSRITREFENRQKELINGFEEKLTKAGFVMVQIQSGMGVRNEIHPLIENEPASLETLEKSSKEGKFPPSQLDELRRRWDSLRRDFDVTTIESKKLSTKLDEALDKLNHSMVAPLVTDKANLLKKRFPSEAVIKYLEEVEEALSGDLDRYHQAEPKQGEDEALAYRKREPFEEFSVNLILDNSETEGVPIITEKSPSYKNLFGSLERVVDRYGYWRTDFTRIFSGSLLKADGGFLVVNAMDLLSEPGVWYPLKRALRNGELEIAGYDPFYMMAGSGIKPEPVPISVKVVLIGEASVYNLLWRLDEDFKKVFRVKAEFDSVMPLTDRNVADYYRYVRRIVDSENLLTFDLSGMQAIAEYGRRLSGQRDRLTVRFTAIADLIRESIYCAQERKGKRVTRGDVNCAIEKKRSRVNLVEEKIQEMFDKEVLMVSTTGTAVGQLNGLSVYDLGEHSFGRPSRITVNTSLGKAGVISIERESELSGPIHDKGVLVLSGFLRLMFAQDKPLEMSASITFEQSYGGVDGDSASSTEIYGILSSLTGIPIKQNIAVTGSLNQTGQSQPIGGINDKVEGWFDVCKSKRLTGDQGVMLPIQNVQDLLLRPDVVGAIRRKQFHLYAVSTISEGIEILTGVPGGTRRPDGSFTPDSVLAKANDKLREMALALENFGRAEHNGEKNNGATKKHTRAKKSAR